MLENYSLDISQFIAGIISTCLGGFIGYFSALKVGKINSRSAAVARLRTAFAPAVAKLLHAKYIGECDVRKFFDDNFLDQAAAIEEFRPFARDKIAYQAAWDDYFGAIYSDDILGDSNLRWLSGQRVELTKEVDCKIVDNLSYIKQKIENIFDCA